MRTDEELTTVATYPDTVEAHIALSLLGENGITGSIQDEALSQLGWSFNRAIGGVRVCVSRSDLEQAARIIAQHDEHFARQREEEAPEEILARTRSGNPRRAFYLAIFSFLIPPLAIWSLWIVIGELTSERRGELTPTDRGKLIRAAVLSVSFLTLYALVAWAN